MPATCFPDREEERRKKKKKEKKLGTSQKKKQKKRFGTATLYIARNVAIKHLRLRAQAIRATAQCTVRFCAASSWECGLDP
jgi:hypothetical protein